MSAEDRALQSRIIMFDKESCIHLRWPPAYIFQRQILSEILILLLSSIGNPHIHMHL